MDDEAWAEHYRQNLDRRYAAHFGCLKNQIAISAVILSILISFPLPSPVLTVQILLGLSICILSAAVLTGSFALYGEVKLYDKLCKGSLDALENCKTQAQVTGRAECKEVHIPCAEPKYEKMAYFSFVAFCTGILLLPLVGIMNLVFRQ